MPLPTFLVSMLCALTLVATAHGSHGRRLVDGTVSARFLRAYPSTVLSRTDSSITLASGSTFSTRTHAMADSYERMLDNATLADMVSLPYVKGALTAAPLRNHDPGRARHTPLFDAMYGGTLAEVRKNCVPIRWVDGSTLLCTSINNVSKHLQAVADELRRLHPTLLRYLSKPGGTLVWRSIAGTDRRSAHSYGIAIDINVAHADYWRNARGSATSLAYKNRIPPQIVDVFERHGFVWGGKWYHYDTMHFEFRPELCTPACSCSQ